ncbi:MAG: metal-dependent hydrolase [Saprospiraceae bacterium]
MDSLTQGLLGAATFAVVKDKEIGKKSLLIGAIAGTIPDLDVFLAPFFNNVEFLTVHRSVSHSIILAILLSLLLGAIFHRIYKKKQSQSKWMFAFFLAIMTHSILDWCTTYGTKLFSPFSSHLFSTNNIHVFEPIYTLILLTGVIILSVKNQPKIGRQKIINLTLLLSTLYLTWTFISKGIANNHFVNELEKQHIEYEKLIVSPTPLNTILWHGIVKTSNGYYFGTYSLFDKRENIEFQFEASANMLIEKVNKNRLVKYYLEYTQDFPLIRADENGNIKIFAIKYGPVNYSGKPEFVYPLSFNINNLEYENIKIDYSGKQRGPVKNYRKLFNRIKGI